MKKLYTLLLICIAFSQNLYTKELDNIYVMPYLKQSNKMNITGLMTGFKLSKNFIFETGFETPLTGFMHNKESESTGFTPSGIDFYFKIQQKIKSILVGYQHSCYHLIDKSWKEKKSIFSTKYIYNEQRKKIKSRNKFFIEF